jgi:hypothetical protein
MIYKVTANIGHNGKDYVPGDSIDLTPAQAESMPWAIDLIPCARIDASEITAKSIDASILSPRSALDYAVAPPKMEASPNIQDQPATDQEAAPAPNIKSKLGKRLK